MQLASNQITLGSGANAGDVTVNFTPDAVGSLYVISVKYDTAAVVGTDVGNKPTVNYTFNTDVGNNGTIDETAVGGITLAPKPAAAGQLQALTLDGDPATESHAPVLKEAALQKLVDRAIEYWAQQGADEEQIALLRETQVQISDLDGNKLAATDAAANLVTIDDDAAGYGWSVRLGEVNPHKVDLLSAGNARVRPCAGL